MLISTPIDLNRLPRTGSPRNCMFIRVADKFEGSKKMTDSKLTNFDSGRSGALALAFALACAAGLLAACGGGDSAPAPSAATLTSRSAESSGANCAAGGVRTQTGPDNNADSVLDAGEVSTTTYACNKGWGTAALIEADNAGSAVNPQVAFDKGGNALAIWAQHMGPGTATSIWSARYTPETGWGAPVLVETEAGDASNPRIAFDASGNALAVWGQEGVVAPFRRSIWANRYTASGWGVPVLIETDDTGTADEAKVVMDAGGNALAVWVQDDGNAQRINSNRYTAATRSWGAAAFVDRADTAGSADVQIALDNTGNAIAVWSQRVGNSSSVWSSRYAVAASAWAAPKLLVTDDALAATSPQIAIDAAGNAWAAWSQVVGTRTHLVANRYSAEAGLWAGAAPLEAGTGDATSQKIAMDDKGNALAVWGQPEGTRYDVWSSRYTAGIGWGTAALLETDNAGTVGSPQIAFDASGNALAVWMQSDGTRFNIWSNRYTAGTGWGAAAAIETRNAGDTYNPQIAIDPSGNALAVWLKWRDASGASDIWANSFR